MKTIAIIFCVALLLLCTSQIPPGFGTFFIAFLFFCVFEYAKQKKMILLAIIAFILGALTVPVALLIEYVF